MRLVTVTMFASVAGLARFAFASTLVVDPGGGAQFTDLQTAIDFAQPGDVIKVVGGTYPPITIDRAVTIIGAPQATIEFGPIVSTGSPHTQRPAIDLNGPGSGRVVLHGIRTKGFASAAQFLTAGAGLGGRGFDEVECLYCELVGAKWQGATSPRSGASGVRVRVPYLVLSGTTVAASDATGSDVDEYACQPNVLDGTPGLVALDPPSGTATVALLDSFVHGGRGSSLCMATVICLGAPDCPIPALGGKGGAGVVAATLFTSGSVVTGGPGAFCICSDSASAHPAGMQPTGPPLAVGTAYEWPNVLATTAPIEIGGTATVGWTTTAPGDLLFVALHPTRPLFAPGAGWFALDPASLVAIVPLPTGPSQFSAPVPTSPALLGVGLALQLYDPVAGLSRPSIDALYGGEWDVRNAFSLDTPKPIPDAVGSTPSTIFSSVTIAGMSGTIDDVDVRVDIVYPFASELRVVLTHPGGTHVMLHDVFGSYAADVMTTYDAITIPVQPLSVLNGMPANGTWTLAVSDMFDVYTLPPAVLESWRLRVITK